MGWFPTEQEGSDSFDRGVPKESQLTSGGETRTCEVASRSPESVKGERNKQGEEKQPKRHARNTGDQKDRGTRFWVFQTIQTTRGYGREGGLGKKNK